jgi:hypothetical protein
LKLLSQEMGFIELYFIYSENGVWEEQWRPLQGAMNLPSVTKEVADHALHGWAKPLVDNLGPPPKGMLHKLPSKRCWHEKNCSFYEARRCELLLSKMPWCFEPAEIFPGNLAAEIVKLWRQGVYVLVVEEFHDQ